MAGGSCRWPTAAVGGLSSLVSPDRIFKRVRKRERERSEGGRDLPDGWRLRRKAPGDQRADADGLRAVARAEPLHNSAPFFFFETDGLFRFFFF